VPRHPPCALSSLATKMLASTVQFSNNKQPHHQPTPNQHTQTSVQAQPGVCGAAGSSPRRNSRPPNPQHTAGSKNQGGPGPFPQDPTGCTRTPPTHPHPRSTPTPAETGTGSTRKARVNQKGSQARFHINEPHPLDTNGRAGMQTWTPNTPSRMSTASGSLERR
jgi:hypothetical protein